MTSAWLVGPVNPTLEQVVDVLAELGLSTVKFTSAEACQRLSAQLGVAPVLIIVSAEKHHLEGARELLRVCAIQDCTSFATLALSDELDLVDERGIWNQADDFLRVPFFHCEVIPRIKRLLRTHPGSSTERPADSLSFDVLSRSAYSDGHELQLTRREFDLLQFLSRHPGRAFSRDALLRSVWPDGDYGEARTVDVHVRRLRSKLGVHSPLIGTLHGVGYRFNPLPSRSRLRAAS